MITDEITAEGIPAQRKNYKRDVSPWKPLHWLGFGIKDLTRGPIGSLAYGLLAFALSVVLVFGLFRLELSYILFPVVAGFMVMGPALAVGLYEKSRILQQGGKPSFLRMIFVRAQSPGQILFVGVMLMLVMMLWLRAAFLLYALVFGLLPFAGFENIIQTLFTTSRGWILLGIGSAVGGLFAAFAFAISAYSIPMLLDRKIDAFTAMGTSWAVAWNNKRVSIVWGAVILTLFTLCVATALIGLIFIFPILGHATWHAYDTMINSGEFEVSHE